MDIVSCAKNILTGCMDVKPEENVLIVTDDNKLAIGQAVSYTHLFWLLRRKRNGRHTALLSGYRRWSGKS